MKLSLTQKIGVVLGCCTLLLHWFCPSAWIEAWHGQIFFPVFSWISDHTIGLLPFSVTYLIILGLIIAMYKWFQRNRWQDLKTRVFWYTFTKRLLSGIGFVIFTFYFLWGFNYDRIQLFERLTWQPEEIRPADFITEGRRQVQRLQMSTLKDRYDLKESLAYKHYRLLEAAIRKDAVDIAQQLGYTKRAKVRCRQLAPSGLLLRFSTAGFYNPFTGECNIDRGLHPLQKPFVMAHEFFHGLGITGEGDCNFLAYVLCSQSDHEFVKYSGELSYWRYLRRGLRRAHAGAYDQMLGDLPLEVIDDLRAIDEQILKYPDIAPRMRDAIYSAYLKSNKIGDGMANYGRIVDLVMSWRKNQEKLP